MDSDIPDFDRSFLPYLNDAFRTHADQICAVHGDQQLTYAELDALSARVANALRRGGFAPGDLGGVYSANSITAFAAALGIVRAGGVWVPINPRHSPAANIEILSHFGCRVLFHQPAFANAAASAAEAIGDATLVPIDRADIPPGNIGWVEAIGDATLVPIDDFPTNSLETWLGDVSPAAPLVERNGRDTLALPQTGGTTGTPKGVMLSHRNFVALAWAGRRRWDGEPRVMLCAAPMTHVGGRAALISLGIGVRLVILGAPHPASILEAIQRERVTDLFLPPTAIYSLLDHPATPTTDFSSLRRFAYGSAPMSIPRLRQAFDVFGPVMVGGFGQTESPIYIAQRETADHFVDGDIHGELLDDDALRSVGRETVLSTVAIVDEDANPVPDGTRGEIAVKGPMVSEGYYRNPEETAKVRRNGWHLTGDIGVVDESGRIYVIDRKKDMIITGGFNVYSGEVEQALLNIDGIAEAAVIGVPSDRWGEEVKAIVRLHPGTDLTEAHIIARSKQAIGSVMSPKTVDLVDELPRTPIGKIDKKALRSHHWNDAGRSI